MFWFSEALSNFSPECLCFHILHFEFLPADSFYFSLLRFSFHFEMARSLEGVHLKRARSLIEKLLNF